MLIDVLKQLIKASDTLSDIIIQQTPGTNGVTKADFDALVSKRDRVTAAINNLVGQGFKPGADLDAACSDLKKQNDLLDNASKTTDAIKQGIDLAGQILAGLAKVVAFFA